MTSLIIFDLDGTLLNTIVDLGGGVNHTLERHGLPLHTIDEYKRMVGHGMRNLVKSALPPTRQEEAFVDGFLKEFLDYYMDHIDIGTRPYPGMVELVEELHSRGVRVAVASNKIQRGTERLIGEFFPGVPFCAVCGNSPDFPLKPDPALVSYIIGKAGVTAEGTVMVGDSGTDIRTAHNAGIKVAAVSWGFRPVEDLGNADWIASSAEELKNILI